MAASLSEFSVSLVIEWSVADRWAASGDGSAVVLKNGRHKSAGKTHHYSSVHHDPFGLHVYMEHIRTAVQVGPVHNRPVSNVMQQIGCLPYNPGTAHIVCRKAFDRAIWAAAVLASVSPWPATHL